MARSDDAYGGRNHFSFALVTSAALCAIAVASGVSLVNWGSPPRTPPPVRVAERAPPVVHTWAVERARVAPQAATAPDAAALTAAAHTLSKMARSRPEPVQPAAVPADRQVASIDPSAIPQPAAVARIASAEAGASRGVGADANPARIVPQVPAVAAPVELVPVPRPRPALLAPPREEDVAPPREDLSPPQERDEAPQRPSHRRLAREVPASPTKEPEDKRNPLEKLFGLPQPGTTAPSTTTAYAPSDGGIGGLFGRKPAASYAPSDGILGGLFGKRPSSSGAGGGTAIYDISAHMVYLPDGRRLEAHSGLGALLDDPNRVNTPNRGATPPAVYDLSVRQSPFHGVRALRLNPVGGSTYGRNGLLAHTYMLGPRGDSNGCVVFRDYDTFLQAFESGTVRRLEVVARR